MQQRNAEVIIVGGGFAGLSAGIYLARANRKTLLIEHGKSMGRWEPEVQNYLGFPRSISGEELLARGREQVRRFGIHFTRDKIVKAWASGDGFSLEGKNHRYFSNRLLLATGAFHLPPQIPGVRECLGHSMFFCKDCDGYRVQNKVVGVYGWTNEAVYYALAMLMYTDCVFILTDGRQPVWDKKHSEWLVENHIPVYPQVVRDVQRNGSQLTGLVLKDGTIVEVQALFTTRGDVFYNELASQLGAALDPDGQVVVDVNMHTSVSGLFAAGCVTPANCQMIVAAGQGAIAAQAINQSLFEQALRSNSLRKQRTKALGTSQSKPQVRRPGEPPYEAGATRVGKRRQAAAALTHV